MSVSTQNYKIICFQACRPMKFSSWRTLICWFSQKWFKKVTFHLFWR